MSLSDIMSSAGLAGYAEAGLLIFLFTYLAIAIWTFRSANRDDWEHAGRLPLADDAFTTSNENQVDLLAGERP